MKPRRIIIIVLMLMLAASCAKDMPIIGAGDPNDEFRQCLRLSSKGRFEDSVQCLEMFKARYPQTPLGQEAELKIGDAYFAKKDYLLAAESYLAFLRLHPRSRRADYAHFRIGMAYFKESPKAIDRDQEYLESAIEQLRIVVNYYSNSSYRGLAGVTLHKALQRVARRTYYIGKFYYRTGEYIACIPRFLEVARKYPDSGLADKALYRAIEASLKLDRLNEAKNAFSSLATDFPDSKYTKAAERKLLSAARREARGSGKNGL